MSRYAWWPIPLLLLLIAGLWVADLRTAYESPALMVLLNVVFTWLVSLSICALTARGFLASGRPGLLMFGCGSLLWGLTSLAAALVVERVNLTITVHNVGVFGAALCHLVGLVWRRRLSRPLAWLVLAYAAALLTGALIFGSAWAGLTPLFFVQGQGGTALRELVLLLATAMFGWVAWQMVYKVRPQSGPFYYWYGLGLGLTATGLTGVMLLSVQGGILGWTNRLTQYLGGAYLFIAAVAAARETGTWSLSLPALEAAWQEDPFLVALWGRRPWRWGAPYGLALVAVAVALELRLALSVWVGPGLPDYITFYPAVMVAALLGGFGPGLAATALAALATDYWVLAPVGQVLTGSPVERLGLLIFIGMGLFMSVVAQFYRRSREKAAAYNREAALRESHARLASFAQATFEGILESEAGRVLDCNEQFAQMVGYTQAELKGMELARLIAPEDIQRVSANIRQGQDVTTENGALRKDGSRLIVETHGRPVCPGSSRRHTAVRDITQRKEAELALQQAQAKLKAHAEELELTVASRTAKLHQTIGELEHFSYAIVHDMRAPLRAMQGFIEAMQDSCGACQHTLNLQYFRRITIACQRMDQLITDSLNYSKAIRQELALESVSLFALLDGMVQTYPNLQADQADILIEPDLPAVLGNPAALTQCFGNLLGNAVKFSKPGTKPSIRIRAEACPPGARPQEALHPTVRIWVEDNGIGIPKGSLQRVFDMFQRASTEHEGTGIGLAIVRKVVQRMGGKVGVISQEGQGSRFWVELARAP